MKKVLSGLLIVSIVTVLSIGLVACGGNGNGGNTPTTQMSSTDLLGMAMVSAGEFLPKEANATTTESTTDATLVVKDIESKIELIMDYVATDNAPSCNIVDYTPEEGNEALKGYTKKMTFIKRDIYGKNDDKYEFYYKEVLLPGEVEEDEDESNEQELEQNFSIEGKLAINGDLDNLYPMTGERTFEQETETEGEVTETECETSFKAVVTLSETSNLVFEYTNETETGEKEEKFTYTILNGNVVADSFTVEIENEENESEIKYSDGEITIKLEQEMKGNDKELELKYQNGKDSPVVKATVKITLEGEGENAVEVRTYKIKGQEQEIVVKDGIIQ